MADKPLRTEGVEEPLEDSAPEMYRLAGELCDPTHGCQGYHRAWQYLRLFGLNSSLNTDAAFFHRQFEALRASNERPRILVSATADYAMLAHLRRVFGTDAYITIVDCCDTSLAINRWYADRFGLSIETIASDVFAFTPAERYDLVTAHSFVGRFPMEQRRELVARWARWLAPRGRIVTSHRIRPDEARDHITYGEPDARRLRERCAPFLADLPHDRGEFEAALDAFTASKGQYTIRSAEELAAPFEAAGLSVSVEPADADMLERDNPVFEAKSSLRVGVMARAAA